MKGSAVLGISVIGLGHLGLPLAGLLAAAGHTIWGLDTDQDHIAKLRGGVVGWHEPGLTALYRSQAANLHVTTDATEAMRGSDVSIIAVPTLEDANGAYDATRVLDAAAAIGTAVHHHDRPHVVVLLSTVMPGTSEGAVSGLLQRLSGRPIGPQLGLCYSPAFGAIGSLLQDYRQPDFLLIGESDSASGTVVANIFGAMHKQPVPVLRRSLLDAELAKIALNNFVITKISFANMIGTLCDRMAGADATQVLSVLGHDRRIGPRFLRAAMPYGGPCFARDVGAMEALARRHGVAVPLATASALVNTNHQAALAASIRGATPAGGTIAILGLAFRHATDVTAASPGLAIAEQMGREGYTVNAWDPLARPSIGHGAQLADSLIAAIRGADTVLIANDDPLCGDLPYIRRHDGKPVVVFDYWHRVPSERRQDFDIRWFG
jgi:UDPglucose 6-dehydrogenase